jgi:hypothetical protein
MSPGEGLGYHSLTGAFDDVVVFQHITENINNNKE